MAIRAQQMMGIRSNALQCLSKIDGIDVRENVNIVEAISALMGQEIEMANAYQVYALDGRDDKFYGAEQTNALFRNLKQCFGECTPWTLDIFYREGWGDELAFHLDRPCSPTCCCLCRPVAHMTDAEGNSLGSIRDPWDVCGSLGFEIIDADGEKVYDLSSGPCPLGFYCPLPWIPTLRDITFTITSADGEEVGVLTKRVPSMFKFLFAPDVDDYRVKWPGVREPKHRALIMASTMFVDFRYFNDNTNDGGRARQKATGAVCWAGDSPSSEACLLAEEAVVPGAALGAVKSGPRATEHHVPSIGAVAHLAHEALESGKRLMKSDISLNLGSEVTVEKGERRGQDGFTVHSSPDEKAYWIAEEKGFLHCCLCWMGHGPVFHMLEGAPGDSKDVLTMHTHRPHCCANPSVHVVTPENDEVIGEVSEHSCCCCCCRAEMLVEVKGAPMYEIHGDLCDLICCNWNHAIEEAHSGEHVGSVEHHSHKMLIEFPSDARSSDKAALLAAALLFDLRGK